MLAFDFDNIFVLFFMIFCTDLTVAGSKKKGQSRSQFTQSLDLVSVLKLSLRRNNDDYKDNPPDNIDNIVPTSTRKIDKLNLHSDTEKYGNNIQLARRVNDEVTDSFRTATKFIDKVRISLLKEKTLREKLDKEDSKPNFMNSLEEIKTDTKITNREVEKEMKRSYFMKSLEEIKIENKNSNKKPSEIETKSNEKSTKFAPKLVNRKSVHTKSQGIRAKLDYAESEPERTTIKDPWFEVINPHRSRKATSHETSLAPYLLGKETTTRLAYKVLTVKVREFRRGGVPHFLQTELDDTGVLVAPIDGDGPMPDFKLPKSRRQFRVDSDDENGEANSAVSGDDDALVPR